MADRPQVLSEEGRRTRAVVHGLRPEDLELPVTAEQARRLTVDEQVAGDHLFEARVVKGLWGSRSR